MPQVSCSSYLSMKRNQYSLPWRAMKPGFVTLLEITNASHKMDLFFPFCTILSVLALPRSHCIWANSSFWAWKKCLSKKAECRPPSICVCTCIKHSFHLTELPDLGSGAMPAFWTSNSSLSPTLKWGAQGLPPLPTMTRSPGPCFHGHPSPCWPEASGAPGLGPEAAPTVLISWGKERFQPFWQVALLLKTFRWRPIHCPQGKVQTLKVASKILSHPLWLLRIFHCVSLSWPSVSNLVPLWTWFSTLKFVRFPWLPGLLMRPSVGLISF